MLGGHDNLPLPALAGGAAIWLAASLILKVTGFLPVVVQPWRRAAAAVEAAWRQSVKYLSRVIVYIVFVLIILFVFANLHDRIATILVAILGLIMAIRNTRSTLSIPIQGFSHHARASAVPISSNAAT